MIDEARPIVVAGRFGIVSAGEKWLVAEIVTPQGHWITHPFRYSREEATQAAQLWADRDSIDERLKEKELDHENETEATDCQPGS